jgi:hypothetical protein
VAGWDVLELYWRGDSFETKEFRTLQNDTVSGSIKAILRIMRLSLVDSNLKCECYYKYEIRIRTEAA